MSIEKLNGEFGIPGAVVFEADEHRLDRIRVTAGDGSEAIVYLLGAQVTHWQPAGAEAVLWVSRQSAFGIGQAIRGGVPVCHPWFGNKADDPGAPLHGFVRLMPWIVESVEQNDDGTVTVAFWIKFDQGTAGWPGFFELRHRITVGPTLTMELTTTNCGRDALTITEALHSYFRVSDVRSVSIDGLAGCTYFGKVTGGANQVQGDGPVGFAGETDNVYLHSRATCVLDDPGMGRKIHVAKRGSRSTVVWNPWIDKARSMPNFGDDEWPEMLCIETANALDDAVTIPPGATHTMAARISLDPPGPDWAEEADETEPAAAPAPCSPGGAIDWTQFTSRIHVKAAPVSLFEAWATADGLARWLLESAAFRPPGDPAARPDGAARAGDAFRWVWKAGGHVMDGTITESAWPERLAFTFGPAGRCEVTLRRAADGTLVEVLHADLPDAATHVECSRGWTFYLTNLKSVLEAGVDLRETDSSRRGVVNLCAGASRGVFTATPLAEE